MKIKIRQATLQDLNRVHQIENDCFPKAEVASYEALKDRILTFKDGFLIGEIDGEIIGFVNGAATNEKTIEDDFFKDMSHHRQKGKTLAVFGLDVHPAHQHKGYARALLNEFISYAKESHREKVILTCKEHLLHYYESFGFINDGISESEHGGATWYDMTLKI